MHYRRLAAALFFTTVVLCAVTAFAQSGRRQTKPAPAAPVPTPTPEPTPIPKKDEQREPELIFLVGADRQGSYSIPVTYYDAIVRGCADRLQEDTSAIVDVAGRDLTRSEAIKKAKSGENTYVVLMGLSYETMARSAEDLVIDFVVFAPETAKVVITGRSYLNSNRSGPLVVGSPKRLPGGLYREEMFRQAGEDAGERILKKIHPQMRPITQLNQRSLRFSPDTTSR